MAEHTAAHIGHSRISWPLLIFLLLFVPSPSPSLVESSAPAVRGGPAVAPSPSSFLENRRRDLGADDASVFDRQRRGHSGSKKKRNSKSPTAGEEGPRTKKSSEAKPPKPAKPPRQQIKRRKCLRKGTCKHCWTEELCDLAGRSAAAKCQWKPAENWRSRRKSRCKGVGGCCVVETSGVGPTPQPFDFGSGSKTAEPIKAPKSTSELTARPSAQPSTEPSDGPTMAPSGSPSVLPSSSPTEDLPNSFTLFDINNDGREDQDDIILVARSIADPLAEIDPGEVEKADVNADGIVNMTDLEEVIAHLFTILPEEELDPLTPDTVDLFSYAALVLPNASQVNDTETNRVVPPILPGARGRRLQTCGRSSFGQYKKGVGSDPDPNWGDPAYVYDPNAKARAADYVAYAGWKTVVIPGIWVLFPDAAKHYSNFLTGTGQDMVIDYEKVIKNAPEAKNKVDELIVSVGAAVKELHDGTEAPFDFHTTALIPKNNGVRIRSNVNWGLILGYHVIWSSGTVTYDPESCNLIASITIKAQDFFDADAPIVIPESVDSQNAKQFENFVNFAVGRFVTFGWSKFFYTHGSIARTEAFPLRCCSDEECAPVADICVCNMCAIQTPSPVPLPQPTEASGPTRPTFPTQTTRRGRTSGVFGDPHMSTFDRLRFDCQAAGEFIMVKSLETDSFMIQERFTDVASNACSQASVSTGFAIAEESLPTVQVSIPRSDVTGATTAGACPIDLFVDGRLKNSLADGAGVDDIAISREDDLIVVFYPYTGLQVRATVRNARSTFGCHFLVQVFLPFSYRFSETLIGLLGKPNGIRGDDWVAPDGTSYSPPMTQAESIFRPSYNYCTQNWCVHDEESSIFSYRDDESFGAMYGCNKTYADQIEAAVANAPEDLNAVCQGSITCLVEGLCGNLEDAETAIADEEDIIATQEDSNPLPTFNWTQIGTTVESESFLLEGPGSVSLSRNGSILAVGYPDYLVQNGDNDFDLNIGQVRVFKNDGSGLWTQIGENITGTGANEYFGFQVRLNPDARFLVVGAPGKYSPQRGIVRIYELDSDGLWKQVGLDVTEGRQDGDRYGEAVAISDDGLVVAVGASSYSSPGNPGRGRALVFAKEGTNWVRRGEETDLLGFDANDRFGVALDLSADGEIFVVTAPRHDIRNSDGILERDRGHVVSFEWDGSQWGQRGQPVNGTTNEKLGDYVSLSSNGNRMAVGTVLRSTVRVYDFIGGRWIQIGGDITPDSAGGLSGRVCMSPDGAVVAVGGTGNIGGLSSRTFSGEVRVYEFNGQEWVQQGQVLTGEPIGSLETFGDQFGSSCSLSGDGTFLAVGIPNGGDPPSYGEVKVYARG